MLVGDNGQRIYTARASLKASGIDVVGRSSILRLNYRTTEQIRRRADSLLPKELIDIDGDTETRATISLLRGPEPEVLDFASPQQEIEAIASRLEHYLTSGFKPRDIALFARTKSLLEERVQAALDLCGYPGAMLSADATLPEDQVALGTMHRAKGLEFKIVMVMACEAGVIPLAKALADAPDAAERKLVLEQERNLLYVAATRAREQLLLSYVGAPSEFLGALEHEV
jgi:superfamily I DNA/RNA helicase